MAVKPGLAPDPQNDRVLRVFVSSTFRDMKRERDLLAKRTFPALRSYCAKRGVTWNEIDLRWGISEEAAAEGRAMEVCLDEIRRCNCFIGMLGERYGCVPSRDLPRGDAADRGPGFEDGKSITECEMEAGALGNPAMSGRCFFYLREPAYLDRLPRKERRSDYVTRDPADRSNLDALKRRIAAFSHAEYTEPTALHERVLGDLQGLIDRLFPSGGPPDPLAEARWSHFAFAAGRSHAYRPHGDAYARLDAHASDNGPPLVVTGDAGIGKSALLASWCRRYRELNPETFVFEHFVGAEPGSFDVNTVLGRCLGELRREFKLRMEIPEDPHGLRVSFANALNRAASAKRLVLLFDGLDQLEDKDGGLDLVWLPRQLPENARVILSTQPGRPLQAALARAWPDLPVTPMESRRTRYRLMYKFLAQYGKQKGLPRDLAREILAAGSSGSPLFLRTLLEELRLLGDPEELRKRGRSYLQAESPRELFERVLERWETDYSGDRPGLVRDVMTHLLAARRGMTERELLDLLGTRKGALPASHWSPLHLASESCLLDRSGVLTFRHDLFRDAVRSRWSRRPKTFHKARLRLADYFEKRLEDPRSVDELPWLLMQAGRWKLLARRLADVSWMSRVWTASPLDVKEYWKALQDHGHGLVKTYRHCLEAPPSPSGLLPYWHLTVLLRDTGQFEPALRLLQSLEHAHETRGEPKELARVLGRQAVIRSGREPETAGRLFDREMEICRSLGDLDGMQRSLGNQANFLLNRGLLREAVALRREEHRIAKELSDRVALARCIGNLAVVCQRQGNWAKAERLHRREYRICQELGDLVGLARSSANLAGILRKRGELSAARSLVEEQRNTWRRLGDRVEEATTVGNLAILDLELRLFESARELAREQMRIAEELESPEARGQALRTLGVIAFESGEFAEAARLHGEAETVFRSQGALADVQDSLYNRAVTLNQGRRPQEALVCLKEQAAVSLQIADRLACFRGLKEEALIHLEQSAPGSALRALDRCRAGCLCRRDPLTSAQVDLVLGQVLLESGDRVRGLRLMNAAVDALPTADRTERVREALILDSAVLSSHGWIPPRKRESRP